MSDLPTKKEIELRLRIERQAQKQKEHKMREDARYLLFCKGKGSYKLLKEKERRWLHHVKRLCYEEYLRDRAVGRNRWSPWKKHKPTAEPMPFKAYIKRWYGSNLTAYRHRDIPRLAQMKWKELQNARNTQVPELSEGERMPGLQRENRSRDAGVLELQVPHLQSDIRSKQGRDQGQKQVRKRSPKKKATDRDAAKVGA